MVGCNKKIRVYDGKSGHTSFCGCTYKGLHLCQKCRYEHDMKVATSGGVKDGNK